MINGSIANDDCNHWNLCFCYSEYPNIPLYSPRVCAHLTPYFSCVQTWDRTLAWWEQSIPSPIYLVSSAKGFFRIGTENWPTKAFVNASSLPLVSWGLLRSQKTQNEATVCWLTAPVQYDLLSSSREYHKNGTVTGRNHYVYNFGPFLIKKSWHSDEWRFIPCPATMSSLTEYVAIQQGAWTTKTWVQGFAWLVDDASDDDQLTRPKPRRTRSENMSDRRFLSWTIPCPLWNNNLEFFSFCHYYSCERLWWSDGFVQTRMANSGKWTRERGIAMSAWYGFFIKAQQH